MKKSNLRAATALQALALMGAGVTTAFVAAVPAAAQDYTSGVITGTVTGANGAQVPGATVTLQSEDQGFTRTTNTGANGQFTFSSLPPGEYDVIVQSAGTTNFRADNVQVVPGQTSDLPIVLTAATAGAAADAEIVVIGRRIQAFTGTTTGATVDVEEITKTIPLGRTLTDVVLLAPGAIKGDASFGNLASIGGSSVAENAYYVNGLNITNFDNYLGSALVPFDFYKSVEVKSGGYPAEFGRATGGIVNAVSKRGTNQLVGALHVNFAPNFLRSNARNVESCDIDGSCTNATNRSEDTAEALSVIAEAGFPIIRDRLFVYGLLEMRRNETVTVNPIGKSANEDDNTSPFYAVKLDAFPIDNHHFEFTYFDTRNVTIRRTRTYTEGDVNIVGDVTSQREFNGGGVNYVGRYTGRLTDWLTVSGAYGKNRDRFDSIGIGAGAGDALIRNSSGATVFGVANNGFFNQQRTATIAAPYRTERKFYRGDVDVLADFFGEHHFRVGFDREDNTLDHASVRSGNQQLCPSGYLSAEACNAGAGSAGVALIYRAADLAGPMAGVPIVEFNYFNSGGSFTSTNTAYYLQDEWKTPLDGLTLNLGIRRDDFLVKNPAGDTFLDLDKNYAPRLGFSYDNNWLGTRGRLFGSYGVYFLPVASNTAFRAVGSEFFTLERFYVTGVGAGGLPILGAQVTNNGDFTDDCVFNMSGAASHTGVNCNQTADGQPKDATYYTAKNLKPTEVSEIILGYRTDMFGMKFELAYTHRQTDNLNEDSNLDEGILKWCEREGIAGCEAEFTGSHQWTIVNVGDDVEVQLDAPGIPEIHDRIITLTGEELGYPKAKRTYDAFDLSWQRPFDGLWSFGGSYTLSWSKGNSEGFVNSDTGQTDAGILTSWDFPGFMDHSNGYLPNDRRHKLRLYGAYAVLPNVILGANMRIDSPRSLSCFGFHPNDHQPGNYTGAYSHFCGGQPVKRGTAQKTDWTTEVNLSGRYNLTAPTGQRITLRADVFNVFNSQAVQYRNEIGDLDSSDFVDNGDPFGTVPTSFDPNPNYGLPTVYQSPRFVRLGLDVFFGGEDIEPPMALVAAPPPPPPPPMAPATQTCADGTVILATDACPAPPPPPPPPAPEPERG